MVRILICPDRLILELKVIDMKTLFATIGCVTLILGLLGSCGVGNFVYMYSDKPIKCIKETT